MKIYKCLLNFLPQAVKKFTACPIYDLTPYDSPTLPLLSLIMYVKEKIK